LNSVVMATGTSYERTRTNAYSEDLRWRIIYQRLALDYSLQRVADNLGVGVATVLRSKGKVFLSVYEWDTPEPVTEPCFPMPIEAP